MCLARHCISCSGAQSGQFPGSRSQPLVFTFEPIPERVCKPRVQKKRSPRVLYPPHLVRRSIPTKKDTAKRLLLFFVSIVLFQVYTATEDELSLSTPDLSAAEQVSTSVPTPPSSESTVLSVLFLTAFPGAEPTAASNLQEGTCSGLVTGVIRSDMKCEMVGFFPGWRNRSNLSPVTFIAIIYPSM
ncbi:radiation-inducible immediate-early gene IEX-1-like [Heterodontus francisci]|uniref:radiation-inducible immediate-early gene IEX-1-like n=1 Tax=Heterodontus francisci TaxID=7792 RepID=UPI00355C122E